MGKRPSFIEAATNCLSFLADDYGFGGPEIERPWDRIPAVTRICYHRRDMTVEIAHVVGFMGENQIETRCHLKDKEGEGGWMPLGSNTTQTGYQVRRALDLQAQAIRSQLDLG